MRGLLRRSGAGRLPGILTEAADAADTGRRVCAAGQRAVRAAGDLGGPGPCRQLVEATLAAFVRIDLRGNHAARAGTFRTTFSCRLPLAREAAPHLAAGGPILPFGQHPREVVPFEADIPLARSGQPAEVAPILVLPASGQGSCRSGGIHPGTGGRRL